MNSWLGLLLDSTIKASLLLGVALVATRMLKHRSAAVRHAVWAATAVCIILLPLLSLVIPAWHTEMLERAASLWGRPKGVTEAPSGSLPAMLVGAVLDAPPRHSPAAWLLLVWAAGCVAVLVRLLAGLARLGWIVPRSEPLFLPKWMHMSLELSEMLGLRRPVRLLEGPRIEMPITWGHLRPKVLLPRGAPQWPAERMRVVLAHELAHIQRMDWLIQILAEIGRAVYWFHPLVWMGCKRLRQESEQACDDAVLAAGITAPDYAEHLLELARTLNSSQRVWSVALAMARPSNLERRFIAMLDRSLNRDNVTRKTRMVTILAAVCLLAPLAALRAPAQQMAGRFAGSVYDPSGGAIPNATLIASNPQAGTRDMTTTGPDGTFEFSGLRVGEYSLTILKPGFARFDLPNLLLHANQPLNQNFTLEVGAISENISVEAKSPAKAQPVNVNQTPQRIRVGGNVQASKLLNPVKPVYPAGAKAAGIEGTVVLMAVVAKEGNLLSLRVMNSQIDPELAKAAVEAVSQWRYQPTLLNGDPVEVVTNINVNFRLAQ